MKDVLTPKLVKMSVPRCGTNITDCLVAAVQYSAEHEIDVEFVHNDRLFRIEFAHLVQQVKEVKEKE